MVGANARDTFKGVAYVFGAIPTLAVAPTPLAAMDNATFSVCGLTPNANTWLEYSLDGPGTTHVRKLNIFLELKNPMLADGKQSDVDGRSSGTS